MFTYAANEFHELQLDSLVASELVKLTGMPVSAINAQIVAGLNFKSGRIFPGTYLCPDG